MAVIVDPANYGKLSLLKPFPAGSMESYPVGAAVRNVRNDEPGLLVPVAA